MKRLSLLAAAVALFAAGCSGSSSAPSTASPTKPTFTSSLSPANEVPPITNAESTASGNATITFDVTRDSANNITASTATFVVNMSGFPAGSAVNIAHIHPGASGTTGGVLVSTTLAAGDVTLVNGSGTFTRAGITVTPEVTQQIINNPAGFYFNVHTTLNGGGVMRGQLVKVS